MPESDDYKDGQELAVIYADAFKDRKAETYYNISSYAKAIESG